jgi:EpsI family protein
MFSTGALILVAIILTKIGPSTRSWRESLTIDLGPPISGSAPEQPRSISPAFFGATALVAAAAVLSFTLPERTEPVMPRSDFADFPNHVGEWNGHQEMLETIYLNKLHLDDYVMANYTRDAVNPLNFYVAYYASQRKGQSTHSPRSCIPGGGWVIRSFEQRTLPIRNSSGATLRVNRAVVEFGLQRQIVYYWFQQRGRVLTNEYLVKWYIFWDALMRNRTDGALVRLTMATRPGVREEQIDTELTQFAAQAEPLLTKFIPN